MAKVRIRGVSLSLLRRGNGRSILGGLFIVADIFRRQMSLERVHDICG